MNAAVDFDAEQATPRRDEIDQLADAIAVHAARIDAATHELLTEIRRFDELGGWAWQGARSCVLWLAWRIGLGLGADDQAVAHGRREVMRA